MAKHEFYLDQKVTHWYRTHFKIEADTLEEAKQKAIQFVQEQGQDELPWEPLGDVIPEPMTVEENGGESTEEIFLTKTGETIWTNKPEETALNNFIIKTDVPQ